MINYEKIVATLQDWKHDTGYAHERRTFSIEPHQEAFCYNIYGTIRVPAVDKIAINRSAKSEVFTLTGITRDCEDIEDKMMLLQQFLNEFTTDFYKQVVELYDLG